MNTLRPIPTFVLTLVLALVLFYACETLAGGEGTSRGSFITYTMPNGNIGFTDSERRVPASATGHFERTWEELESAQEQKFTPAPSRMPFRPADHEDGEPNPNHTEDCTGTMHVIPTRVQQGAHNRTMYSVVDGCGNVVSTTRETPKVIAVP